MKILSDGIAFQNTFQRGIQRYFYELFTRLARDCEIEMYLTAPALAPLPPGVKVTLIDGLLPRSRWNLSGRISRHLRRMRALKIFNQSRCDLFHSTFFTRSPVAGLTEIVTVYDMLLEDHPWAFGWKWRMAMVRPLARKRRSIRAAGHIITISHSTAADVVRHFPAQKSKVRPILLGSEHLERANVDPDHQPDPFILMVGQRIAYKNFKMLLDAMVHPHWPTAIKMVIVGPPLAPDEIEKISSLGLSDRVKGRGYVPDAELSDLYTRATAFVFPSRAEGFGFPLIEAQCRGTVVACSDIAIFREVAGEGALYFDPQSPPAIAQTVRRCCDPQLRRSLIEHGFANSSRFSWDQCAAQTLDVYHEAVGAKPSSPGGK